MMFFSWTLAAKGTWKLIFLEGLWKRVLMRRYIFPRSLEDLIKTIDKKFIRLPIFQKAMVISFDMIENPI
jgi:hypothetical protein